MSRGEPALTAASVASRSACTAAVSGGVARERGEEEGVFLSSAGEGSHGGTSPLAVRRVPPSPSGSGEDFLFRPRRYFLSEEEVGEESAEAGKPDQQHSCQHQQDQQRHIKAFVTEKLLI